VTRLGLHWPDATRTYADGTPFVERMVIRSGVPQEEYHPDECHDRVALLAANHPASDILVRVDFREGQAIPHGACERAEYLSRLAWAVNRPAYHDLGSRAIFQMGNEPQLEGAPHAGDLVDIFNGPGGNFVGTVKSWTPTARTAFVPIAPYHPDRLGAPPNSSEEGSPWSDLYQRILDDVLSGGAAPDVLSVHVYGDPTQGQVADFPREPWEDTNKVAEGWRFAMNVARTWADIHDDAGWNGPVWVTEFNTAARGQNPSMNYPARWLLHALGAMAALIPGLEAACWFVGEGRGVWDAYALHGRRGNMPTAEADFNWMQVHGL
jgi:hypothetical protein